MSIRLGISRRLVAACFMAALIICSASAEAGNTHLLWQDTVAGSPAMAVAAFGDMVFAVGSGFAPRAYDAVTGDLLWEGEPSGGGGEDYYATAVAASEQEVIACGVLGDQFGVAAYDRRSGQRLWEDRAGPGDARACKAHDNLVMVAGPLWTPGTGFDATLRTYDAQTGVLLWEDRVDGGARVADVASALAVVGGRVFLGGGIQEVAGDDDMLVRAYDADTGALIWHEVFAGPAGERDEATALAAEGNRLFVAGWSSLTPGTFGNTAAVRAYDARTGRLLWVDYHEQEEVQDIAVQGNRVVAAGGETGGAAVVRAYDAKSGAPLWTDRAGTHSSIALAVDTHGKLAYWAGQTRAEGSVMSTFIVRALDLRTGAPVWEDLKEDGRANDVVAGGGRLFAVGNDLNERGYAVDFVIRAYGVQPAPDCEVDAEGRPRILHGDRDSEWRHDRALYGKDDHRRAAQRYRSH